MSNQFDSLSVCNAFGDTGSQFSSSSIRNQFQPVRKPVCRLSPYSQFTSTPPSILYRGSVVGHS